MLKRLDHILNTPTKVAVLRLLCESRGWFTGRDIARRVKKGVANVHRALDELGAAGVVNVEPRPPVKLFRIAEAVPMVEQGLIPLFRAEADLEEALWAKLAEAAGPDLVSMILFGSRARGESKPGSDVDVLFILRNASAQARILDAAFDLGHEHGVGIQPLFVQLEEVPSWARDSRPFWRRLEADGRVIRGLPLREVEHDVSASVAVVG